MPCHGCCRGERHFFAKPRPTCTALFHQYYFAAGLVIDNMSAGPLHYKAESMGSDYRANSCLIADVKTTPLARTSPKETTGMHKALLVVQYPGTWIHQPRRRRQRRLCSHYRGSEFRPHRLNEGQRFLTSWPSSETAVLPPSIFPSSIDRLR